MRRLRAQGALGRLRAVEIVMGQALSWGLLVVVLVQVLDRFGFGGRLQLAWTEEIARIALVWYAFWGAILVQDEQSHIQLQFLEQALSGPARRALRLVIDAVVALFLVVLLWFASAYAWHERDFRLPATGLRRSVFVLAVAVSSALMLAHTGAALVARTRAEAALDRRDG